MASGGQPPPYQPSAPPVGMYQQPPAGAYPAQPPPGAYPAQPPLGAYPTQPPPGVYPQKPGEKGAVTHTTVTKTTVVQQKPKKGLFGTIASDLKSAANTVSKEADSLSKSVSKSIDATWTSKETRGLASRIMKVMDKVTFDVAYYGEKARFQNLMMFKQGNVVQLVSKASGKALQIVQAANGQLVVDGCGMEGPSATNAVWTVEVLGNNVVKLHNNYNYLAVINGCTTLIYFPPQSGYALGTEANFRLQQISNFILLDSIKEPGHHVGVLPTGELKSAVATGKEDHGQFGVRLIYTPQVVQPVPNVKR